MIIRDRMILHTKSESERTEVMVETSTSEDGFSFSISKDIGITIPKSQIIDFIKGRIINVHYIQWTANVQATMEYNGGLRIQIDSPYGWLDFIIPPEEVGRLLYRMVGMI